MATFTVEPARTQRMTFQSQQDSVVVTWHKDYFIEVTGAADDTLISPYDVLTATGLPTVNRTIYSLDGKIIPFVVCKHKTAEQHPKSLTRWTVKTQWQTFSGDSNQDESDNVFSK